MLKKIGGWGSVIGLVILIFFIIKGVIKTKNRKNNAAYINGISDGVKKGVRGTLNLHYNFIVNDVIYTGSVPEEFCRDCIKCCDSGSTVIVRYERGNPVNNDLVYSLPVKSP